jgi:tetratricopeptide (TPR) repeat protein
LLNVILIDQESNEALLLSLDVALNKLNDAMLKHKVDYSLAYAEQIIEQAPNCLSAYTSLYKVLSFQQRFSDLEKVALQAIKHNPKHPLSYNFLSNAYRFQRKTTQALKAMEKAVELSPENTDWLNNLGIMYKELGQLDKALKHFEQCIIQSPSFTKAYWNRSDIIPKMPNKYIEQLTTLLNSNETLAIKEQVYAAYALFKHYESIECFDEAFTYLKLGAQKQRNSFNYDHQSELNEHASITQVFNSNLLKQAFTDINISEDEIFDDSPIFICGLPRSGTTLAEQIVSSHTKVAAGDELFELAQATQYVLQKVKPNQPFPFLAKELTNEHWKDIGKQYLNLTKHINTQRYFTDKMPLNYKAIGLIHMSLPCAKIIYCQRPPMDLLLGAYKQILDQGNRYTYDLDELTSMIIAHHQLMQHWIKLLPNKIFTLNYKDLIQDQKKTTENLLNFLGLAWQDECLNFHKNNRVIHTISNTQVRQPLFMKSLNSWHKYKTQLSPYAEKMQKAGLL